MKVEGISVNITKLHLHSILRQFLSNTLLCATPSPSSSSYLSLNLAVFTVWLPSLAHILRIHIPEQTVLLPSLYVKPATHAVHTVLAAGVHAAVWPTPEPHTVHATKTWQILFFY